MRHRKRPIEFINVGFGQVEKLEEQLRKSFGQSASTSRRTALPRLERRSSCSMRAQEVLRFLFVDVEIAVPSDAKGVHAVENQTRETIRRCAV